MNIGVCMQPHVPPEADMPTSQLLEPVRTTSHGERCDGVQGREMRHRSWGVWVGLSAATHALRRETWEQGQRSRGPGDHGGRDRAENGKQPAALEETGRIRPPHLGGGHNPTGNADNRGWNVRIQR